MHFNIFTRIDEKYNQTGCRSSARATEPKSENATLGLKLKMSRGFPNGPYNVTVPLRLILYDWDFADVLRDLPKQTAAQMKHE